MLDFLLKNQPEFLEKFREYSKENFVFKEAVIDFMTSNQIAQMPISDEIITTTTFDTYYGGENYEVVFSDNLNIIIATNYKLEEDNAYKAQILITNKIGSTKMNCHAVNYKSNPFPIDFTLEGIGAVEHFFLNEGNSKIHEIKFGTWRLPNESEFAKNKILNLFPAILEENLPSIEIKFSKEEDNENILIHFKYKSGKVIVDEIDNEDFDISLKINKKKSEFLISAYRNPDELKLYIRENIKDATHAIVYDSISKWLSTEVELDDILAKADSEEIKITYTNFSLNSSRKPHPTEEEIQQIEKCDPGESRTSSRPGRNETPGGETTRNNRTPINPRVWTR